MFCVLLLLQSQRMVLGSDVHQLLLRPAICAISTMKYAPTSSAISRNFAKSIARGYADAPATINFGLMLNAF